MMSNKIGIRIAKLRAGKNLSQNELRVQLEEQGLTVRRETITQWENGSRDLKTEYTVTLAKFFGVTTDYLLGNSDVPTTDIELKGICDYTGLSQDAVNVLHKSKDSHLFNENIVDTVNTLLEDVVDMAATRHPVLLSIASFLNANPNDEEIILDKNCRIIPATGDPNSPYYDLVKDHTPDIDLLRRAGLIVMRRSELENVFLLEVQHNLKTMKVLTRSVKQGLKQKG